MSKTKLNESNILKSHKRLHNEVNRLTKQNELLSWGLERISDVNSTIHQTVEASQDREIERMHGLVDKLEKELDVSYEVQDKLQNVIGKQQLKLQKTGNKNEVLWDLILSK